MGPPDALQETTRRTDPASGAPDKATCQLFELGALISNGQERTTGRAQVHTSHVCREVCKRVGSPNPHHRMRSRASGPLPRELYKCARTPNTHQRTHPERPVLSVKLFAEVRPHRTQEQGQACVRCSASDTQP